MIVRPAREADIPAIATVAAASYASGFAGILSPEELAVRNAASFAPLFVAALPLLRVAEVDGAIAGFSKVTAGHLDMLFIDPAAQRSGVDRSCLPRPRRGEPARSNASGTTAPRAASTSGMGGRWHEATNANSWGG